jgi:hypothetical protein
MSIDTNGRTHGTRDGKYAVEARGEAVTTSLTPERDWGTTGVTEGSRTPWGSADWVDEVASGITSVSTPGHGGIKLSPARNKAVPAGLRRSSGWYEEDCEAHIVAFVHPDSGHDQATAEQAVKDWFPDGYEKATGTVLAPGESQTKDVAAFAAAHAGDLLNDWASTSDAHPGMAEVGTHDAAGAERVFLVPTEEYRARGKNNELGQNGRFIIDPARHQEITKPAAPPEPKVATARFVTVDRTKLTPSGLARLDKDLAVRYRHENGTVASVGQMLASGHMSGKTVSVDNGKRSYFLRAQEHEGDSNSYSYKVSKSTWEAFEGPDDRTDAARAAQEWQVAEHKAPGPRNRFNRW